MTWAQYDPIGFARAEDSFVSYGVANYSEQHTAQNSAYHTHMSAAQEECRRRALPDDCQVMIDQRARRENIGGFDGLLEMDVDHTSNEASESTVPIVPLFFPSPISHPQAALQSPPSPIADPLCLSTEFQQLFPPSPSIDALRLSADFRPEQLPDLDRSPNGRPPTPPLRSASSADQPMVFAQSQLLRSAPEISESAPQPLRPLTRRPRRPPGVPTREQMDELPMLDQGWSVARNTPRKHGERSQPRKPLVYRIDRVHDDISTDIHAGMREEEDATIGLSRSAGRLNGVLGMSPNIICSPSPGRPDWASNQPFPFKFSAPARPVASPLLPARSCPTVTYAGRNRTVMTSPIRNRTFEAPPSKRLRSGLSHSSPSYGDPGNPLPDSKKYPSVASLLANWSSNQLPTHQTPIRAQTATPLSISGPTPSPLPGSSSLPTSPLSVLSPLSASPPASPLPLAAPDHWCNILVKTYDYAVGDSRAWGGGDEWIDLVTMVMEFLAPLIENGQYPVRLPFNLFLPLLTCSSLIQETPNHPELIMVRPEEVLRWQRNNRPLEDMFITQLPVFITMWWAWWSLMQPRSRIAPDTLVLVESSYTMDWSPLHQPGQNGLILVVMTLRWWGVQSKASREWREALADATSAILCMTDGLEDGGVGPSQQGPKPNAFKNLLAPEGPHAYDTAANNKRKRDAGKSRPQATISQPRSQRVVSAMPPPSSSQASATQRRVSAPTGRTTGLTMKPKAAKPSWCWAPTTSSPQAGAQVDEEMTETLPRETRAHKRKREGEA